VVRLRITGGALIVTAALVAAASLRAAPPTGGTLKAVWLGNGRIHATYRVPNGWVPYKLQFYAPSKTWASQNYWLFPWDNNYGGASVSNTQWLSLKSDESILVSGTDYVVRLFYGPKASCTNVAQCPKAVRSNAVILKAGTVPSVFGPGSLVQSSSGSGDFASASVSASVKSPNKFTVRVSSSPSGQSVHVTWDITCSKGYAVKGASGAWDDTTPVNDDTSIRVPFATLLANPDSCTIAVGADLQSDPASTDAPTGTITLRLYADKSHL
jgi:hypothetical protein